MASKKTSPVAASEGAVLNTKENLLAELEEQQAEMAAAEPAQSDVVLQHGTRLATNTVYEDRTLNPEEERVVEYELEVVKLGNGTILTNVGVEKF